MWTCSERSITQLLLLLLFLFLLEFTSWSTCVRICTGCRWPLLLYLALVFKYHVFFSLTDTSSIQRDFSGKMGFTEFKELWGVLNQWKQTFMTFDRDRSGQIEGHELAGALGAFGEFEIFKTLLVILYSCLSFPIPCNFFFFLNFNIWMLLYIHICVSF